MNDPAQTDLSKDAAARAAVALVQPGMRLGLGTGSTAAIFVRRLAERVRAEGFALRCAATSKATAELATSLGLTVEALDDIGWLDLTIDGADEVGPGLALIKGGGAALLREKIVAATSKRMIVIADAGKKVASLGAYPLPIEVNPFGLGSTEIAVRRVADQHGATGMVTLRRRPDGQPLVTDGGHYILDAFFGRISRPEALALDLFRVPGVVEHGLFLGLCRRAYIAGAGGVETIDA